MAIRYFCRCATRRPAETLVLSGVLFELEDKSWTQTQANPGPRLRDLKNELDHGRTIAETASFLCRDVYEVRAKMKELRLTEQPGNRRVVL
jgi:hypothetical protein